MSYPKTSSIQPASFNRLNAVFDARHFDTIIDGFESRMTIYFFVYFMSQGILTAGAILWMVGTLR